MDHAWQSSAGGIIMALCPPFGETRDMNSEPEVCPNCRVEVVFIHPNGLPQCPECGAAFGGVAEPSDPGAVAMSLVKAFSWLMVAMLGVAGVTVAVVFVGCAVSCSDL
jgi:hypothetical protein